MSLLNALCMSYVSALQLSLLMRGARDRSTGNTYHAQSACSSDAGRHALLVFANLLGSSCSVSPLLLLLLTLVLVLLLPLLGSQPDPELPLPLSGDMGSSLSNNVDLTCLPMPVPAAVILATSAFADASLACFLLRRTISSSSSSTSSSLSSPSSAASSFFFFGVWPLVFFSFPSFFFFVCSFSFCFSFCFFDFSFPFFDFFSTCGHGYRRWGTRPTRPTLPCS